MTEELSSAGESLPLPVLERIDRVCIDFEAAWQRGSTPRLEDYLGLAEAAERGQLLRELLLLELDYLSRRDEHPTPDAYKVRFPHHDDVITEVFERVSTGSPLADTLPVQPPPLFRSPTLPCEFGGYELLEVLGEGGMGIVFRARQRTPDRIVALKIVRPDRLAAARPGGRDKAVERFRAEAQAAARLEHEGILPVYEVGEVDGQPFFTMRFVEGRGLDDLLRDGPLASRDAAGLLEPVARAVQYAHDQDVIHRDIKPRNILLDTHGRTYVADFGLAKSLAAVQELTETKEVLGTPAYMSPEQARGAAGVDRRTDVYSLGATLYELLTGRPPFRAATPLETQRQVVENEPVPPRQLNPAVARDLETVCLKCLQKDPDARYRSAEELAAELGRFLRGEATRARPLSVVGRGAKWCRRNPWMATALGLVLVVAIAAPVTAIIQRNLAVSNGQLAEENATLAAGLEAANKGLNAANQKLNQANEELKQSYFTVTKQKDELRRRLLNSDLIRIPNLMALPDVRLSRRLLERHIPRPGEQDFRSFAWQYWWRECQQEDRTIALDAYRSVVELSPDGKQQKGRTIAGGAYCHVVAISPDGKLLGAPGSVGFVLVDVRACRTIPMRGDQATIGSMMKVGPLVKVMVFTSEEQLLTVSYQGPVFLGMPATAKEPQASFRPKVVRWSIEHAEDQYSVRVQKETILDVNSLVFPKGSDRVAVGGMPEGVPGTQADATLGPAAVAPDASCVAVVASIMAARDLRKVVAVWGSQSGQLLQTVEVRSRDPAIMSAKLAFARDWLVLADSNGMLQAWRRRSADGTFEEYAQFPESNGKDHGNRSGITCIAFQNPADSRFAAADRTGRVVMFDLSAKSETVIREGQDQATTSIAFLPDGSPAIASEDRTIAVGTVRPEPPGRTWTVYKGHDAGVAWIGYSQAAQALVSLGRDKTLKRWRLPQAKLPSTLSALAISPDFRVALTREVRPLRQVGSLVLEGEYRLQLRDLQTCKAKGKVFGEPGRGLGQRPNMARFLPRGRVLTQYAFGKLLQIWNSETGEKEYERKDVGRDPIGQVAVAGDGGLIALASRSGILLLDGDRLVEYAKIACEYTVGVCFTPRSELLVVDSASEFSLWTTTKEPQQKERFKLSKDAPQNVAWVFSSDGRFVLTTLSDGAIRLWDLESRRAVQTFVGNPSPVRTAALHPDGRTLATMGETIKLWDLATGEENLTLDGQGGGAPSLPGAASSPGLHFSPDGGILAADGDPVRLWYTAGDQPLAPAGAFPSERQQLMQQPIPPPQR